MMAACKKSGVPALSGDVKFTLPDSVSGKRVNNDISRKLLGGWKPKYESFDAFMAAGGKDFYTS